MNYKLAFALGLIAPGTVGREPVAYLYNGVRLPGLPEWDKTVYPYAYIASSFMGYRLILTNLPLYQARFTDTDNLTHPISAGREVNYLRYTCGFSADAWSFDSSGSEVNPEPNDILWCNSDLKVCETDTDLSGFMVTDEVYLPASDPIPVYD